MPLLGIVSYVLQPLQKLFRPTTTNSVASMAFTFYPSFCYVRLESFSSNYDDDFLLIAIFIYYFAFFCYACESKQRQPVLNAYRSLFELKNVDYDDFMMWFNDDILFKTFNKMEQKAVIGIFSSGVFPEAPPYMLLTDKEKEVVAQLSDLKQLGHYSFNLIEGSTGFIPRLELSRGMDMLLFPLSVGHLYRFVDERLESTKSRKLLRKLSVELIDSLKEQKPTVSWQKTMPDKLLRDAGRF
jgi:hypothetical protein